MPEEIPHNPVEEPVTQIPLLQLAEFDPGASLFPLPGDHAPWGADANVSPDLAAFTMVLDSFFAELAPGTPSAFHRVSYVFQFVVRRNPQAAGSTVSLPLRFVVCGWASATAAVQGQLLLLVGDTVHTRTFTGPIDSAYRWDLEYAIPASVLGAGDEERIEVVMIGSVRSHAPWGAAILTVDTIDGRLAPAPTIEERERQATCVQAAIGRRRERAEERRQERSAKK